jgi:microcystin-dependent protein/nitrate reductase NapE component
MELTRIRGGTSGTSSVLQTGDVIQSIIIPSTSIVERGSYTFLVWASQITIGHPNSTAQVKDSRLQNLFEKLWLQNAYSLSPVRGTISTSDWTALKVLTLPSLQGRTLSVFNAESALQNGASTASLSISNLPAHSHGGGNHGHSGYVNYVFWPHQILGGYYNSYAGQGGWTAISGWTTNTPGVVINASGNTISTEGSGTPIAIIPPRAAIVRCLLICL